MASSGASEFEIQQPGGWGDEVDEEPMEDARPRDSMSSEEDERIDISLLDEEDDWDSGAVVAGSREAVVDLSQDDGESEGAIDLTQDDTLVEYVGEPHHRAAVKSEPPSSPAVVRTTRLHAAFAEWLQSGLSPQLNNCHVPQHDYWGELMCQAAHDPAVKVCVLRDLHDTLFAMKEHISGRKQVAEEDIQRWNFEIHAAKRKLHDDAIRELEGQGHDDNVSESIEAFKHQVRGPDGDRLQQCEESREQSIIRKTEKQAQLSCVDSMLALIELERLKIRPKPTAASAKSRDTLVARVVSEMDVYAVEFETRWALEPAGRCQLVVETISFWSVARFWLPAWVRKLVARKLESIPVQAAKQALVGLACDLHWSEALAA